jgi:hypothetical protein
MCRTISRVDNLPYFKSGRCGVSFGKNVTWIIAIVELTVNIPSLPSSGVNSLVTQRARISFTGLGASVAIFTV